jgi:hypothetical protein
VSFLPKDPEQHKTKSSERKILFLFLTVNLQAHCAKAKKFDQFFYTVEFLCDLIVISAERSTAA